MSCTSGGSITRFILDNLPEDTALIGSCADYHSNLPESLVKYFNGKIYQITRYFGVNHSIVIPGDDNFFDNPESYYPKNDIPFDKKRNRVFWRGACSWEGRAEIVIALNKLPGCDVKLTKKRCHEEFIAKRNVPESCFSEIVEPDEFTKYRIWLSIEGWGCASDTTRALMSGCAVIYFRNTAPWFNKYLKHEVNCIIIDCEDITTLIETIKKMLKNTEFTKKIAENGRKTAREIFRPEVYKQFILNQL
jgi:hypothetical protein